MRHFIAARLGWVRKPVSRVMALVSVILSVGVITALAAPANAITEEEDAEIAAALASIGDGTWTEADLDYLRLYPEVAAQVIDPTSHEIDTVDVFDYPPPGLDPDSADPGSADAGTMAAATCRKATVTYTKRTLLGFVAYKWHHTVGRCYSGGMITRIYDRYDYVTDKDANFYVRGLGDQRLYGVGRTTGIHTWPDRSRIAL